MEAIQLMTRFACSGTLGQARAAGVVKTTSRIERRRQRSMPLAGEAVLGFYTKSSLAGGTPAFFFCFGVEVFRIYDIAVMPSP